MVQSVLKNSLSQERGNVCPITASIGREPSPPIRKFIQSSTTKKVTLTQAKCESAHNVQELVKLRDKLHPLIQSNLLKNRNQARESASSGQLPNLTEGD